MKIVAMAMFLGEDKVPLRIGKTQLYVARCGTTLEDKVPLRIGKFKNEIVKAKEKVEDKVPLRIGKWYSRSVGRRSGKRR